LKAFGGFALEAYADPETDKNAGIFINSKATTYPLQIIGNESDEDDANYYFKVSWSG
jgi:hypothetical protein